MTTNIDQLIEVLRGIGLDKNESRVYLSILELGPSPVWDIAKKTLIKRPTCYVILDELVFRGIASKTSDGKRTVYSVLSPKQLLMRVNSRLERFSKSISELDALASSSIVKPSIRVFEGIAGLEQAYNLTLGEPNNSEILIYGTAQVERAYAQFIPDYLGHRVKKGIHVRAILADTVDNQAILSRDTKELRETRFIPREQFNPSLEINIFGNTIIYIAHSEKEPFATVIENKAIADFERQKFELLWNIAKK